jgi:hypothetical protein
LRNKLWFKSAEPVLNEFWKTIEHEKINGYDHRAPNKKIKNFNKELPFNEICKNKCLINVTKLFNVEEPAVLGEEPHLEEDVVLDE